MVPRQSDERTLAVREQSSLPQEPNYNIAAQLSSEKTMNDEDEFNSYRQEELTKEYEDTTVYDFIKPSNQAIWATVHFS